ncbi:MAG: COX15/CtaA family protein [Alphaproteobacteria bacterium]|nr:COX15/CtaA family protein [Alphaproteobacteria bacterium]
MQPLPIHLPSISRWLIACMAMVVLMVLIGGVTRLTESGLSIVEWKPITGILPPLSKDAWQREFTEYQSSPEFIHKNAHFTVEDFKGIFWLEYIHRVAGRITGLVFLLPWIYFATKRMLPAPLLKRMAIAGILVAAQGTVGWIMVASGLENQPRVAPIKLGIHLTLAFSIFAYVYWTWLQIHGQPRHSSHRGAAIAARALLFLTAIQIFLGALVAGLDAGLIYNTYPLMDGKLVPNGIALLEPWWLNHLEHVPMVQFQHRMAAVVLVIATFAFMYYAYPRMHIMERERLKNLMWVLLLQFALGIYTLISVVNIWLASLHQLNALLLIAVLVRIIYALPLKK